MKSQQQNWTFFYQLPKLRSIYKGEFNVINFSVNHLKWQVNHLKWQVNHLKWQLIMINFRFYSRNRWLIRVINRLRTLIVESELRMYDSTKVNWEDQRLFFWQCQLIWFFGVVNGRFVVINCSLAWLTGK